MIGKLGARIMGDGKIAKQIHSLAKMANHMYFQDRTFPKLNKQRHDEYKVEQLKLFKY